MYSNRRQPARQNIDSGSLLLKLCDQVSSEVCKAFSLCRQGRSSELLVTYKSSPCPPLPPVQRDKQASAVSDGDDSSGNELDASQVHTLLDYLLVL